MKHCETQGITKVPKSDFVEAVVDAGHRKSQEEMRFKNREKTVVRDKKGRFGTGTAPGPGRPKASGKTFMAMCKLALKEKDPETKQSNYYMIIQKAIDQAKAGDWKAREWLANRADGKPVEEVHRFDFDTEEVKVIQ